MIEPTRIRLLELRVLLLIDYKTKAMVTIVQSH